MTAITGLTGLSTLFAAIIDLRDLRPRFIASRQTPKHNTARVQQRR